MGKSNPSVNKNAVLEISLSAIEHNLNVVKDKLPAGHPVMAVVKANAYGHGDKAVAGFLEGKVDWFAVNSIQEGIRLREHGIKSPILIFGVPETDCSDSYGNYNLTATVSDLSHFDLLENDTDYHLNIDTGMGRLGINSNEIEKVIDQIVAYPQLNCKGIYSHFATADAPGSEQVYKQLEQFKVLQKKISGEKLFHIANTGGVFFYPKTSFDMVRTGIALYGYSPGQTSIKKLQPALKFQTHFVQVKTLKEGDTVSYGARWKAKKTTNIGVIPVGYEDGIRRDLTGQLKVQIEGKLYPIVGTITMNYCMVNLGSDHFDEKTKVYLLDGKTLDAQNWASTLNTIPYEVLTSLPRSLPRVYRD